MKLAKIFSLVTAMLMLCVGSAFAQGGQMVKKIDSFDFFVDQSGSMMMTHGEINKNKMDIAKEVLIRVNEKIPNLDYAGGLHTFAGFKEVVPVAPYNKAQMHDGVKTLKNNLEIFGRFTPIGDSLSSLNSVISGMARPAAVILVTDGENNYGVDPVAEAQAIYAANPNVCFHIISLADNKNGKMVVDQIAKLNSCTVMVDAKDLLLSDAAVDKFVADVFYTYGGKIVLRSVQFELGSDRITNSSAAILDEVAGMLKGQTRNIQIDGHTCNLGSASLNQGLSERRANAVRSYLAKRGVDANKMHTTGYGLSMPKYDNGREESRRLNRRAEIDLK